jgi:Fanconi anemia group J protein
MEGLFCTNTAPTTVIQSNQLEYFVNDMLKTFNAVGKYTQDIIDVVEKLLTEDSNLMSPIIAPHITFAGDLAEVLQNAVKHAAAYNIFIGSRVEIDGDECPGMVIQCMKPSVAFHAVAEKARSVIITSGTLSPMNTFEAELAEKFPTKIEAPHVVPNDHVYVEVTSAIGEVTYKATDGHVQGPKFAKKLGEYLLKYAQVIPGGMLVFLPKYSLIDRVLREWHVTGLFGKMNDYKRVVVETRGARGFQDTLNEFNLGNTNGKGSLMLAVYRGKVSEGIDFKDDSARAVFCVGIPFPSVYDIKVKAKKEFNDLPVSRAQGMLSGGEWYRAQAYRAYNQALGRCIRHPKDYAALFLVDSRFRESRWMLNNISKWIRNNAQASDDVNQSVRVVDGFFKRLRGASDGNAPAGSTAKHEETQQKENLLCGLGCEKNAALCAALERLHEASMLSPEEPMKVNAYAKALTSIRALKYEVTSGAKMSKAGPDKVQHVGPSMGAQIDFFLKHGVFERMEYYERKELPPSSAK